MRLAYDLQPDVDTLLSFDDDFDGIVDRLDPAEA